ncbi:hypothetical protein J3F83DRAFT_341109 [Trichoderma novae-zelandiae]
MDTEGWREREYLAAIVSACTYHAAVPLAGYFLHVCLRLGNTAWRAMRRPLLAAPNLPRLLACIAMQQVALRISLAAASRFRHVIVARALRAMRAAERVAVVPSRPSARLVVGTLSPLLPSHHGRIRQAGRRTDGQYGVMLVTRRSGSKWHVCSESVEMFVWPSVRSIKGGKGLSSVLFGRGKWSGVVESAVPGPATRVASHHIAAVKGLQIHAQRAERDMGDWARGRWAGFDKEQRETRVGSAHRLRRLTFIRVDKVPKIDDLDVSRRSLAGAARTGTDVIGS